MRRTLPALAAALAAGAALSVLSAGVAWGAADILPKLDDAARYRACTALIADDPGAAFDSALAWRYEDGGAPAWHCVGLALVALGYDAEAGEVFERLAGDMAAEDAPARVSLRAQVLGQAGQAWLQAGEPGRAGAALDKALEIDPQNPELLMDRAQAYAAAGDYWEAVGDLDRALENAPPDGRLRSDAYGFRAAAYRYLEILDLARDDVARALALAPNDPALLLERGNIRRISGDDDGARADWLRILTESPESPAAEAAQTNLERLDVKTD